MSLEYGAGLFHGVLLTIFVAVVLGVTYYAGWRARGQR